MALNVLVTGAAGYIGSVLCEHLLAAGHRVTALDNLTYSGSGLLPLCGDERFKFVYGDVRDEQLLARLLPSADVVIPLAALVGAPLCERDPWQAKAVNVEAVRALNRLRSRDQLVIYPNTNSGYGTRTGEEYCTEDTSLEPISLYGKTKVAAEAELLGSPNVIALRLATVFGVSPRMRIDLLVNSFVYAAVTEGYLVVFEREFKRNFVHVRDVADCVLHCIEKSNKMVGRVYNVGLDTANVSKEELALMIKQRVPNFYVHFAEVGRDPDRRNYIVSNQRLRDAGFEAKRSLEVGIQELIKCYQLMGRVALRNV